MFSNLLTLLPKDFEFITVGVIAHEMALFLLRNKGLVPENAHCKLPHPSRGHRGMVPFFFCSQVVDLYQACSKKGRSLHGGA
jgi:hypothetical protein